MSGYIGIGRGYGPFNGGGSGSNSSNPKTACKATPIVNINISNPGTDIFDGYTASNGDRILVQAQTLQQQNGIYIFNGSGSAMTRSSDANTWASLVGATTYIQQGTINQGTTWRADILAGGTININAMPWILLNDSELPIGSKTQLGILQVGTYIDVNSGIINLPQSIATTASPTFAGLTVGADILTDVFEVNGNSSMSNTLFISTPIPLDPINQSPQLFMTKTNQGVGEFSAFTLGFKDEWNAGYILSADFAGTPLPTPHPIYINPLGGNVSVGALDISDIGAQAQLHVLSDSRVGVIISGASTNKNKQLQLGFNIDTLKAEIQSYFDSDNH